LAILPARSPALTARALQPKTRRFPVCACAGVAAGRGRLVGLVKASPEEMRIVRKRLRKLYKYTPGAGKPKSTLGKPQLIFIRTGYSKVAAYSAPSRTPVPIKKVRCVVYVSQRARNTEIAVHSAVTIPMHQVGVVGAMRRNGHPVSIDDRQGECRFEQRD
jgi:hypothetical protein